MNGRVYDPVLGRFLSADPNVDGAGDAQGFNRYSYVGNNPLGATDPTGFFGLKDALKMVAIIVVGVVTAGAAIYAAVALAGGSIGFGAAIMAVVTGGLGPLGAVIAGAAGGFGSSFAGSLLNGGSLGDAFKAGLVGGLVGGVTAGLTYGIGSLAQADKWNWAETALAHGAVQGGMTEITGGQFRHGFYAGFAASAAGGLIDKIPGRDLGAIAERVTASAVVGGTASVLGGGKFANGAVSGAFVRLFNEEAHRKLFDKNPDVMDIGNDAHRTMQQKARDTAPLDAFTEVGSDGDGSWFGGGRPDIGNRSLRELLEIKPANYAGYFAGRVKLEFYELFAPGYHDGNGDWLFKGSPIMELKGEYATYTYFNMHDGVILYTYKLNPEFSLAPVSVPVSSRIVVPIGRGVPLPIVP